MSRAEKDAGKGRKIFPFVPIALLTSVDEVAILYVISCDYEEVIANVCE